MQGVITCYVMFFNVIPSVVMLGVVLAIIVEPIFRASKTQIFTKELLVSHFEFRN